MHISKKKVYLNKCDNDILQSPAQPIQLAYMMPFLLTRISKELAPFPHVAEFALNKCSTIRFNSLPIEARPTLRIFCVMQGRFYWTAGKHLHALYPGDVAIVLPGLAFGGTNGYLDIGTVTWIEVDVNRFPGEKGISPGTWSNLSSKEKAVIKKIFSLHYKTVVSLPGVGTLLQDMHGEMMSSDIGHVTRVNQMIDELLIMIARSLCRQKIPHRDFPIGFIKLEKSLKENLSHQWTVDEMASLVGLGHWYALGFRPVGT